MIHPDEALQIITSFKTVPQTECVSLGAALGRVLPNTVFGQFDQPPFDKAAMDGFAWSPSSGESLPSAPLRIRGTVAAGDDISSPLKAGEALRIMTGAPLPLGSSMIQRVEWTTEADGFVTFTKAEHYNNIIRQGDNSLSGDTILTPRILRAQDIAILASDGRKDVSVSRPVVVGVFSTGSELVEPGQKISGGLIYDSNRPMLLAQLSLPSCKLLDFGSVSDDYDKTVSVISHALLSCDILLLSGGVSMGDFDFVPRALATCGVEELFHSVRMKPGKPTYFGKTDKSFVFGLPGNPVSVFVNTEIMVKTLIYALSGIEYQAPQASVPLSSSICRKATDRVEYVPVQIDSNGVHSIPYQGSSAIQALALADGFVRLEIGESELAEGKIVNVRFVR